MNRRALLRGLSAMTLAWLSGAHRAHAAVLPEPTLRRIALPEGFRWPTQPQLAAGGGRVLLLGADNLWLLGMNAPVFAQPLPVTAIAISDAGTPLALVDGQIGLIRGQLFLPILSPPQADVRLAGGPGDTVHLFGIRAPSPVYRFDGRRAALLARFDTPVRALCHLGETTLAASTGGIFSLRAGEAPGLLFPLPTGLQLTGLAADPHTAELYAASEDALWRLDEGAMIQIASDVGGALAWTDRTLLIADGRRQTLYRLSRG